MRLRAIPWLAAALCIAAVMSVRADEKADALTKQVREAAAKVQSVKADVEIVQGEGAAAKTFTGTVALKKPNLARFEVKGLPISAVYSDGKSQFTYTARNDTYTKRDLSNLNPSFPGAPQLAGLLKPELALNIPKDVSPTYLGKQTVEGAEYEVIEVVYKPVPITQPDAKPDAKKPTFEQSYKYFISPKDGLIYRTESISKLGDRKVVTTATLKNVQVDVPLDEAFFAFTPPATAKIYVPPTAEQIAKERAEKLVKVGALAPDFQLAQPGGGRLVLSDLVKTKKATLVNFFFVN